jgi:hypothetical protein
MNPQTISRGWLAFAFLAWTLLVGIAGWQTGREQEQDRAAAAAAKLKADQAEQLAQAVASARRQFEAEAERGNRLEAALLASQRQFAEEKRQLQRRIADVTTLYRPAAGEGLRPLPRCIFTAGFLRQYNAALGLPGADPAAGTGGAEGTAPASGAADAGLLESGLHQADILGHIADYGERCRGLEAQVNGLIDYVEGAGGSE